MKRLNNGQFLRAIAFSLYIKKLKIKFSKKNWHSKIERKKNIKNYQILYTYLSLKHPVIHPNINIIFFMELYITIYFYFWYLLIIKLEICILIEILIKLNEKSLFVKSFFLWKKKRCFENIKTNKKF